MINVKGAKRFCCEDISQIENYIQAISDKNQVWCCHHRREYDESTGKFTLSFELKNQGLYYHRPSSELIFMTLSDHRALHYKDPRVAEKMRQVHHSQRGVHLSEETRRKISRSLKGSKHPLYGKHLSEETRRKISESNRGKLKGRHLSEETKRKMSESRRGERKSEEWKKRISNAHKGRHWYNNGVDCVMTYECPVGYVPGKLYGISDEGKARLSERMRNRVVSKETRDKISKSKTGIRYGEEVRRRLSESHRGKKCSASHRRNIAESKMGCHWFNNGIENKFARECPPDFVPGQLKKPKEK